MAQPQKHHAMNWSPYEGNVQVKAEPTGAASTADHHFDMAAFIAAKQQQQQFNPQFYPDTIMNGGSLFNNNGMPSAAHCHDMFGSVDQQHQQLREHLQRHQQHQQQHSQIPQFYSQSQQQPPATPYMPNNFNPLTPPSNASSAAMFAAVQQLQVHQQQHQQHQHQHQQQQQQQHAEFDPKHDQLHQQHANKQLLASPATPTDSSARLARAADNISPHPLILTPNTTPPRNLDNTTPSMNGAADHAPVTPLSAKSDSPSTKLQLQPIAPKLESGHNETGASTPANNITASILNTPSTSSDRHHSSTSTAASMGSPVSSETSKTSAKNFEDDIFKPLFNAKGIPKKHKCKTCDYATIIKAELWSHRTQHMNAEKILRCPQCPFVTEYKHHLDFHVGNHNGAKPFHCQQCTYRCVNKSMLKSHMKSHSDVHDYKCADCPYVAKYCHSMKTHLRNRQHRPAQELNDEGVPKAFIDVYGSRRGPKSRRESGGSSGGGASSPKKPRRPRVKRELIAAAGSSVGGEASPAAAVAAASMQTTTLAPMATGMLQQPAVPNLNHMLWTETQQAYLRECLQQQQQQQHHNQEHQHRHLPAPFETEQQAAMRHMLLLLAKFKQGMTLPPVSEADMSMDESDHNNDDDDDDDVDEHDYNDDDDYNGHHIHSNNGIHSNGLDLSVSHAIDTVAAGKPAPLPMSSTSSDTPKMSTMHRRKGRAFKLNDIATAPTANDRLPSIVDTDDDDEVLHKEELTSNITLSRNGSIEKPAASSCSSASVAARPASCEQQQLLPTTPVSRTNPSPTTTTVVFNRSTSMSPVLPLQQPPSLPSMYGAECRHCGIHFCDAVIHRLHMSYHSFSDPFTCNVCGMKCTDRVHFNMHIATDAH